MNIDWMGIVASVISTVIFTTIGLAFFGIAFAVITRLVPFSMRKEIEEDQNTALGIILGAVILGIALIISSILGVPSSQ